jgi:hypothetical protein
MKKYVIVGLGIATLVLVSINRFGGQEDATKISVDPISAEVPGPDVSPEAAPKHEPTPPSQPLPPVSPPEKTVLQRIAQNDASVFKLSPEQIQAFLSNRGTNAETLLAAFNVSGDKAFLRQAVEQFPDSAFVLAAALAQDALPEQRSHLLAKLKELSPDNPLANYLSARDYLKQQQPDLALKEFQEAAAKSGFYDFTVERIQGLEEMYLAVGYSAAEAKALAMTSVHLPAVSQMRDLGREMSRLQQQYANAGDGASAEVLAKMGVALANDISGSSARSLLGEIVGSIVEREFLKGLDPGGTYDFLPATVNERLAELTEQERRVRESSRFVDQWMRTASEAQLVSYFDRLKLYGEAGAITWARGQVAEARPVP